jgi:hypothetical protein
MALSRYLSNSEKNTLVHTISLLGLVQGTIQEQKNSKKPDNEYMELLTKAAEYLEKAKTLRMSALEIDAQKDLARRIKSTEPMLFLSSYQAKKEFEEHMKIRTMFHIPMDDLFDLYGAIIERMCKTCRNGNFKKCRLYQFLVKYGIEPYDPDEKKWCPYAYTKGGRVIDKS